MITQRLILVAGLVIILSITAVSSYSFARRKIIARNNECSRLVAPCPFSIIPRSIWEIISGTSGSVVPGYVQGRFGRRNDIACDQFATTTDCTTIVDARPPSVTLATTSANPVQSGIIDEHLAVNNALRDVNFCGSTYRVKQIIIDGVDVVQRIAELVKESQISTNGNVASFVRSICESVTFNRQSELDIEHISVFALGPSSNESTNVREKTNTYRIYTQIWQAVVNPTMNEIYSIDGYDGSVIGPIGKLK